MSGIRTMLLRQCYAHAEKFWTIARRWPTGNQLAAVFDVSTSGSCVGSMCPVPVVRIPGVEHFITTRSDAFVAHNCLNTSGRWRHLKYNTSVGQRTWPEKIESIACETKDEMMLLTVKDNASVDAPTRISSTGMQKNTSTRILLCIRMVKLMH